MKLKEENEKLIKTLKD